MSVSGRFIGIKRIMMKWKKIENDVNDCTKRRACGKTKQYIRKLWFNKSVRNSLGDEQKNDGIYMKALQKLEQIENIVEDWLISSRVNVQGELTAPWIKNP